MDEWRRTILEIRDGRAEVYPGTYDDYLWSLEKGSLKERFNGGEQAATPSKAKTVDKAVENATKSEPRDQTKRYQAEAKESAKRLKKQEALLEVETAKLAKLNSEIIGAAGGRL